VIMSKNGNGDSYNEVIIYKRNVLLIVEIIHII
jgi:hypothetical protein